MRILILTDQGFEEAELLVPYYRLQEPGWLVRVAAPRPGRLEGKHGYPFSVELGLDAVEEDQVDALVLPGGHAPERLAEVPEAVALVRRLGERGIPLAAICHGPLLLARAGLVEGRALTGYPAIWPELKAAGGRVEDASSVVDDNWVTARRPDDIPAWMRRFVARLSPNTGPLI